MSKPQTTKQQQPPPPAIPTVADAEQVLADLDAQRRHLAAARAADDAEMSKHAYRAHALCELGATERLDEISKRAIERDQRLRELDLAIAEARERLAAAKAAEARAVDQARAEEARKLVDELAEVFPYIDKHLAAAANALIAINDGITKLHQAGFAFPSDSHLRL